MCQLSMAMILSPSVPSIRPDSVKSYKAESICSGGGGTLVHIGEEGTQNLDGNELLQMNLRRMFEDRILTDFTIVCELWPPVSNVKKVCRHIQRSWW